MALCLRCYLFEHIIKSGLQQQQQQQQQQQNNFRSADYYFSKHIPGNKGFFVCDLTKYNPPTHPQKKMKQKLSGRQKDNKNGEKEEKTLEILLLSYFVSLSSAFFFLECFSDCLLLFFAVFTYGVLLGLVLALLFLSF